MKLNLGCCDTILPDFVNVDLVEGQGVFQANLAVPWPWDDSTASEIIANDIIEHLPHKIHTMNEMYRVLEPGRSASISVPTTNGTGAFQDPTHVSYWNRRSFAYYEAGNPYRERFARHYGITARFRVVSEETTDTIDGERLSITLEALK